MHAKFTSVQMEAHTDELRFDAGCKRRPIKSLASETSESIHM